MVILSDSMKRLFHMAKPNSDDHRCRRLKAVPTDGQSLCVFVYSSQKFITQESSAKLTNQRVSYAFTSSPFSFHSCHILPASKFQYSYSCILLLQASVNSMYENCECEYSPLVWRFLFR